MDLQRMFDMIGGVFGVVLGLMILFVFLYMKQKWRAERAEAVLKAAGIAIPTTTWY